MDELEEIRVRRETLLQVKAFIERMLSDLEEAVKAKEEADKQNVREYTIPAENEENRKLLGWLRKRLDEAEKNGWIESKTFDNSLLKIRLKQQEHLKEIERWVKWVNETAKKKSEAK